MTCTPTATRKTNPKSATSWHTARGWGRAWATLGTVLAWLLGAGSAGLLAQAPAATPASATAIAPFAFVQLCDPQLGMNGYEHDVASFERAVTLINGLAIDFTVICGDLVNQVDEHSIADFRRIAAGLRQPVYCAPGNHDVGIPPTAASLQAYRDRLGPDFLAFEHKGMTVVIVDTCLWAKADAGGEAARQDAWFRETLAAARLKGSPVIVAGHHPPFVDTPEEADGYSNLPLAKRQEVLDLLSQGGVAAVLAGHTHTTRMRDYKGIPLVMGEGTSINFDKRPLGVRIWHVTPPATLRHEFVPLPEPVPPAPAAPAP
jgi:predicted phosphodiesterase